MKILVTGGAGFIGSNFIRLILAKYPDYEIVNLDKLTYCGNIDNLNDVEKNPNYKFIKGDICDAKVVKRALKRCDVVVNFAASTHVDRSILDAGDFVKTNFVGVHCMLEEAKKTSVKLFIQISTDEVYGSIKKGSFSETSPLSPNSPYAASKAAGDLLPLSYKRTFGMPVIVVRSTNNFGPYQYPEKLIPLFITNALDNKKLPVYGDGMNVRDWIYVKDNCQAIDRVLHWGKAGEIYNIGAGNEFTNISVTKFILKSLKKPNSLMKFVTDRQGHDFRYSLRIDKIGKLGFKPRASFKKALSETINWYKQNRKWWEKIKKKSKEYSSYYTTQYSKR